VDSKDPVVWHEVLHSLTRIESRNTIADERAERMEERIESLEKRVENVDESLRGNGRPGLKERHVGLEQRVNNVSSILKWIAGVGAAVIAAGISWILFN